MRGFLKKILGTNYKIKVPTKEQLTQSLIQQDRHYKKLSNKIANLVEEISRVERQTIQTKNQLKKNYPLRET